MGGKGVVLGGAEGEEVGEGKGTDKGLEKTKTTAYGNGDIDDDDDIRGRGVNGEQKEALLEICRLPAALTNGKWARLKKAEIRTFDEDLLGVAVDLDLKAKSRRRFLEQTGLEEVLS